MTIALPAGWDLVSFDDVGSTNAEAMQLARSGRGGPLWVWAQSQSSGRGRQGKAWASVPGNLYCTALLNIDLEPPVWTQLSFVAGLAAYDAAVRCLRPVQTPWRLALKWPNDLLLNGSKVTGILLESTVVPELGPALALGIGINVQHSPDDAPPPYHATHLCALGGEIRVEQVLEALAFAFAEWQQVWADGTGFARIREAWTERAHGIGEQVTVNMPDETLTGRFVGLDDDGAMMLEPASGPQRRILVGDLFLASQAARAAEASGG